MNIEISPTKAKFLNKILTSQEILLCLTPEKTIIQQLNNSHTLMTNLILDKSFFETYEVTNKTTIKLNKPYFYSNSQSINISLNSNLNIKFKFQNAILTHVLNIIPDSLFEIHHEAEIYPFPLNFNEILKNIDDTEIMIEFGNFIKIKGNFVDILLNFKGDFHKGIVFVNDLKLVFSFIEFFHKVSYSCDGENVNFIFDGDNFLWSVFITI